VNILQEEEARLLEEFIHRYSDLQVCANQIRRAFHILAEAFHNGGKLLVCGNGGSAADAQHMVGELMKSFLRERPLSEDKKRLFISSAAENGKYIADRLQSALPAISLFGETSLISAYMNDVEADMVFAQQVYAYGQHGDVLLALSTSGNSQNVVNALWVAKCTGMHTIGLTGADGGMAGKICDITIKVPRRSTPEIQEAHLPIYHTLCAMLEAHFFS